MLDGLRRLRLQFEDWRLRRAGIYPFEPDWTVPPGDTLLELMAERDMSDVDLARKMLTDLPHVHGLIGGWEPLTESDALDLEEIFGVSFDFWMNYERRYREDLARLHPGMTVDLRRHPDPHGIGTLAEENFIDVTVCEFCGGPLDAEHPWRRGVDGAAAHEACLVQEDTG
jgi:plasmid maintenance system antidote protein VapI